VRIAVHSAPQSLDPHLQNEVLTAAVLSNVYDGLTEFDRESKLVPALAAEWTNPDDRTWVFRLRPGVKFHDGRALSAADVVFSLERARRHPGSGLASFLVEVESVREVDPSTVEVRTARPFAALLAKLSPVAVVPRDAPEVIVSPIGTGSYRLLSAGKDRIELQRFPGDWRSVPAPPRLTFLVAGDPVRRVEMLLAGEVDVAAGLAGEAGERLAGASCCREVAQPGSTVEYLRLSTIVPPFRDARVREAVSLAIDREAYIAQALRGRGQPASQLVVPGVFGYAPDLKAVARDVPRARRLLAEAGLAGGIDVVLEYRSGRRGDLLAAQLAEAGIRVTPQETAWTDLHPRIRKGEVGFYFGGVVAPTAEASDVLDGFVHSRNEARGYGVTNHSRYSNPQADALIEAAATTLDMTRRRELLQEAMRVAVADRFLVPVAGLYEVYGVSRKVRFEPRLDMKLLGREIVRGPSGG
jgi:peptide/nickel transport system substrate-binding protein